MNKLKLVLALLLAMPTLLLGAQGIAEAMRGSGFPTSYKPADLPEDYKAAEITVSGGDLFSSYFSLPFLGTGDVGPSVRIYEALKMTWTKGETVMVEGQKFLVTYKLDVDPVKLSMLRNSEGVGLPDAMMTLHLLRTDSITSIEPEPTFTKERLLEAVGTSIGRSTNQTSALKSETLSNVKQLALGTIMYSSDYDDVFPYAQTTRAVAYVTEPYMKNRALWQTRNPNGGKIQFNMALAGVMGSDIPTPSETPMFWETQLWPDGSRVVAFADGHVKAVSGESLAAFEKAIFLHFKRRGKPLPPNYGRQFRFPDESPPPKG